jgi:hypothetical protein
MQRRPLTFTNFFDVIADVNHLRRGYTPGGNWTLAQVCRHLDIAMTNAMRPGPYPENTPIQNQNRPALEDILETGMLPEGIPATAEGVPPADAPESAIDNFLVTLKKYEAHTDAYAPHRLFGDMKRFEARKLALIHCAHHLSHLLPTTARL